MDYYVTITHLSLHWDQDITQERTHRGRFEHGPYNTTFPVVKSCWSDQSRERFSPFAGLVRVGRGWEEKKLAKGTKKP